MLDVNLVRSKFRYDPETGAITRTGSQKSAVCVKELRSGRNSRRCAYVSVAGRSQLASHVAYALVHGIDPSGVRTKFRDGDQTNLRLANMAFSSNMPGAPGDLRTNPAILKAIEDLGGRASTTAIRRATGITRQLSMYFKILEKDGKIHAVDVDEKGAAGNYQALIWALGPGDGTSRELVESLRRRAAEARTKKPAAAVDHDARDAARSRREAAESVRLARAGVIANSVFTFAAFSGAQQVSQC